MQPIALETQVAINALHAEFLTNLETKPEQTSGRRNERFRFSVYQYVFSALTALFFKQY